jgi:hypothetical protein
MVFMNVPQLSIRDLNSHINVVGGKIEDMASPLRSVVPFLPRALDLTSCTAG